MLNDIANDNSSYYFLLDPKKPLLQVTPDKASIQFFHRWKCVFKSSQYPSHLVKHNQNEKLNEKKFQLFSTYHIEQKRKNQQIFIFHSETNKRMEKEYKKKKSEKEFFKY